MSYLSLGLRIICCGHLKEVNPSFDHFHSSQLRLQVSVAHHGFSSFLGDLGLCLLKRNQWLITCSSMEAYIPSKLDTTDLSVSRNKACGLELNNTLVFQRESRLISTDDSSWTRESCSTVLEILREGIVQGWLLALDITIHLLRVGQILLLSWEQSDCR